MHSEIQERQSDITRAAEILNALAEQRDGHMCEKRTTKRVPLARPMIITETNGSPPATHEVLTRNLSESGICFLYKEELELGEYIILLDAEERLAFRVEVVRARELQDNLHEYGARFLQRVLM